MKIMRLVRLSIGVLSIYGAPLMASDFQPSIGRSVQPRALPKPSRLSHTDIECSVCLGPCFKRIAHLKRIAVFPCAHMDHLSCYKNLKQKECPYCRQTVVPADVQICYHADQVVSLLQQKVFTSHSHLAFANAQLETAHEQIGHLTTALERANQDLANSRNRVATLTNQVERLEYEQVCTLGGVTTTCGLIIAAVGVKVLLNARTARTSNR